MSDRGTRHTHRETFRLRYLILMVWEDQVDAASMQVHGVPKVPPGHSTALDVPSRTALTERSFPENIPVFGFICLPRWFAVLHVQGRTYVNGTVIAGIKRREPWDG